MTDGILGYAHYEDGTCKPVPQNNPKLRGFKVNGLRPHIIVLFTDDPDYYGSALRTVCPTDGKIYKATAL